MFSCWCNTGLIATSSFILDNPELEANDETKEMKTHLFNVMPIQFHSTVHE